MFKTTLPVMMGYVPLGAAFGVLAVKTGVSFYYILALSMFVYAGAGQFLILALFSANASVLTIGISVFLLNLRHMFYSLSMISSFKDVKFGKWYLIFSLTDETFALLKTSKIEHKQKDKIYFLISFLNQIYWIIGSILGAVGANLVSFSYKGIEFCLSALFVVLSIELYKESKNQKTLALAFLLGLFGMLFLPSENMLIITLSICLLALLVLKRWVNE